jgi:hypothetical protein
MERSFIDEKDKNGEQMGSRNARMAWYDPVDPWMWLKATSMGPLEQARHIGNCFVSHRKKLRCQQQKRSPTKDLMVMPRFL